MTRIRHHIFRSALLLIAAQSAYAQTSEESAPSTPLPPAEEVRLNASQFRDALKKRGLTDILELYLREFPPGGNTEAVVALRDVKLAEFQDPRRPRADRYAAIAEGNDLLEEAIHANPTDPRRFEWYFTLAHSLVYHEAEPYFTPIVYHGGTQAQRRRLASFTTRALQALDTLQKELTIEFERLEQLSPAEYERLDRNGYIETVDRLPARADYLRLWTLYYDSLTRNCDDTVRIRNLNEIRGHFVNHSVLLSAAHEVSRIQLQALLLAGATYRLLNDLPSARDHLERALSLAERLDDTERQRVQWAITFAHVERIRTSRDAHDFEGAPAALARFRASIPADAPDSFGRLLVAALVERSVWLTAAQHAEQAKKAADATRFRDKSWQSLAELAGSHPDRRDELYAALYAATEPDANPQALDPLDTAALLAGLLSDAGRQRLDQSNMAPDATMLLERAVSVGESFLSRARGSEQALSPEIMFNVGVAEYRLGRSAAAADRFFRLARDRGDSPLAESALTYAVELSAWALRQPGGDSNENQVRYADAMQLLLARHSQSEAGKYWRFFYARHLAEQGAHAAAAEQFAMVATDHEFALEAQLNRLQSLSRNLQSMPHIEAEDQIATRKAAATILEQYETFANDLKRHIEIETDDAAKGKLRNLRTRAQIVAAEVQVHPASGKAATALEQLADIESELADQPALLAAVWRTRLVAYQQTGALAEAAEALPRYVEADPKGAPSTLQHLYSAMMSEAESARETGQPDVAADKAQVAVLLAEQLGKFDRPGAATGLMSDERQHDLQLAEALILTRAYARARDVARPLIDPDSAGQTPRDEWDTRARFALGEAYFGLSDHESALKIFNVLATRLPAQHPLRWRALVRDLQCRTALGQAPADILKVIAQQRYLFPELGGPNRTRDFEQLERQNRARP